MKEYRLSIGTPQVSFYFTVKAESDDEALRKATAQLNEVAGAENGFLLSDYADIYDCNLYFAGDGKPITQEAIQLEDVTEAE